MQAIHFERMPARAAKFAMPARPLSPPVLRALEARGVKQLFTHQAQVSCGPVSACHTIWLKQVEVLRQLVMEIEAEGYGIAMPLLPYICTVWAATAQRSRA